MERLAAAIAQRLEMRDGRIKAKQITLVDKHCAHCHMGDDAQGDFHLDRPLTAQNRFAMVRRMLSTDPTEQAPMDNPNLDDKTRAAIVRQIVEEGEAIEMTATRKGKSNAKPVFSARDVADADPKR